MKGCWMELSETKSGSSLRVKVDDGVIVFPVTAKGKLAVAEGVFEATPMTRDQYVAWQAHLAERARPEIRCRDCGERPLPRPPAPRHRREDR